VGRWSSVFWQLHFHFHGTRRSFKPPENPQACFPPVNNQNLSGQQLFQKLCLTLCRAGLGIFKSFNRVTALGDKRQWSRLQRTISHCPRSGKTVENQTEVHEKLVSHTSPRPSKAGRKMKMDPANDQQRETLWKFA